jgi:hypothetical protein
VAFWKATAGTVTDPAGSIRSTGAPLLDLWMRMQPADVAELSAEDFARVKLPASPRPPGSLPIKWRGAGPAEGHTRIRRDDAVGGSDALGMFAGVRGLVVAGVWIDVANRAGVFTEKGGVGDVMFDRCRWIGKGSAYDPHWTDTGRWGLRLYDFGRLVIRDAFAASIFGEHWLYDECRTDDLEIDGFDVRHCGRCAVQLVNRPPPDGSNPGRGNVLIANGKVTDVCLEQGGGGSAFHFAGGAPDSTIRIQDVQVNLGCDPSLAFPFANNVTGAISAIDGDPTFPGGYKAIELDGLVARVGLVFGGRGTARRANVDVGNAGVLRIRRTYLEQGPLAHPTALLVRPSCGPVEIEASSVEVHGRVKYRGEPEYLTWQSFRDAHPELFG